MSNLNELSLAEKKKLLKQRIEEAEQDPLIFINHFVYTFDPRLPKPNIPFNLFDYQEKLVNEVLKAIMSGYDIFIDKSRDVGATYTVLATLLWFWLYRDGSNFLLGSRKESYVDNRFGLSGGAEVSNKEESLFGKLDYLMTHLPYFMLPGGFNARKHNGYMKLLNPANGNVVSGESSNSNFSRGGRQKAILLDEFAFWENDFSSWGATADTTNCRIVLTTPGIKPGKAKRLRFGKDGEEIKIIELDYRQDPRKDKNWELRERARRSEEDFGREIQRNWDTSIQGRVYDDIIGVKVGLYQYMPYHPLYISWDFGLDGTAIQWWQIDVKNGKPRLIEAYFNSNQPIQFFFPLFDNPIDSTFKYSKYDLEMMRRTKEYTKAIHFGDPDVAKRSYQSKAKTSTREALESVGIYLQTNTEANDFYTRWEKTKVFLRNGIYINDTHGTQEWLEAMQEARFPQRPENTQATTAITKPIHDWTCLSGDTLIRTLRGWIPIKKLVKKNFYVYSFSPKEKRLVPVLAKKCWQSGTVKKLLKIVFDNGWWIKCTPEHRIMLRTGGYKEARFLEVNDSVMPFYEYEDRGYKRIILNDGSYAHEHRYIYSRLHGFIERGMHIDHIDGDKTNNNPNNLQMLNQYDHFMKSKIWKTNRKIAEKKRVDTITAQTYMKKCPICLKYKMMSFKSVYCSPKCRQKASTAQCRIDRIAKHTKQKVCCFCGAQYMGYPRDKTCSPKCAKLRTVRFKKLYSKAIRGGQKIRMTEVDLFKNHLIMSITTVNKENIPVYDIEVPYYHNFVAGSIVVHNSHHRSATEYLVVNLPREKREKMEAVETPVILDPYD